MVCVAAGYSLIAASLADLLPSTCWDRPLWQRYWEIISVRSPDIAIWTSLLPSSLYTSSPLPLLPCLQFCSISLSPSPLSHHVLPSAVVGPWQLSGNILPLPVHLAIAIGAWRKCWWISPLIKGDAGMDFYWKLSVKVLWITLTNYKLILNSQLTNKKHNNVREKILPD